MNDMNILTVNGEQYNVADKTARGKIANDVANVIKETITGTTVSTDMVSPIEHDVECKIESKNLFDISKITDVTNSNGRAIINNKDGSISIKTNIEGAPAASDKLLKDILRGGSVGDEITLAATTSAEKQGKFIYLSKASMAWKFGTSIVLTDNILNSPVLFYGDGSNSFVKLYNIIAARGGKPLEYIPNIPDLSTVTVTQNPGGKTFKPNAEGIVTGMKSISPSMTILTDNPGANLEVTYSVDTKKYVESKQTGFDIVDSLPTANEENYKKAKLYLNGGSLSYMVQKPAVESLAPLTDLPVYDTYACNARYGKYIYIFGGLRGRDAVNNIIKFDTSNNSSTVISEKLPVPIHSATAATIGDSIYILGGRGSNNDPVYNKKTIYRFDCKSEKIEKEIIELPKTLNIFSSVSYGESIYLFGGTDNAIIYKYTPSAQSIQNIATFPKQFYCNIAVAYKENAYIFPFETPCKQIYKFSFQDYSVKAVALDSELPTSHYISGDVLGDKLYLAGFDYETSYGTKIFSYDFEKNHIEQTTLELSSAVYSCTVKTVNDELYILGGYRFSVGPVLKTYKLKTRTFYGYATLATTAQTTELTNAVLSQGGNV